VQAALFRLWADGHVEPAEAPPLPFHLLAQQLLALTLQEGSLGGAVWREWLGSPFVLGEDVEARADEVVSFLVNSRFVHLDTGMWTMGTSGDEAFGRRLVRVEPSPVPGYARWRGGTRSLSFELSRAVREVLAGDDPPVALTERAHHALAEARAEASWVNTTGSTVVTDHRGRVRWWTFAGLRANATLATALRSEGIGVSSFDDLSIRAEEGVSADTIADAALSSSSTPTARVEAPRGAAEGLKFAQALPPSLAGEVISHRLEDPIAAAVVRAEPIYRYTDGVG